MTKSVWMSGAAAWALSAGLASAAAPEQSGIDELVITADRSGFGAEVVQIGGFRNARVLDTPLTVNVVPRAVLDSQMALGLYDALRNTGGVTRSQLNGATYDNIAIRGILVENRGNYRLNGSLPVINLVEQPLENKARVEVLKGAAALYYGYVPPSGLINMTTKRPGPDPVTEVVLRADNHGSRNIAVDFSRASPVVGVRLNAAAGRVDTGQQYVRGDRSMAAVAVDLKPTDRLTIRLDGELIEKSISEPAAIALPAPVAGAITLPEVPDPRLNLAAGDWFNYDANAANALVSVNYKLTDMLALRLEAGHAETHRDRVFSSFAFANPAALTTGAGTLQMQRTKGQKYTNDNLRAEVSAAVSTGPIQHEATVGWAMNQREQNGRASQTATAAQNFYRPVEIAERPLTTFPLGVNPSRIIDRGLYVFDRMTWGPVQVIGGLRWAEYKSRASNGVQRADEVSPTVSLIYQPLPWLSVYGTYVEALEEGGIAPLTAVNAFEVLPPGQSTQWEGGVKAELFGGVVASAAYFEITRPSSFTDAVTRRFVQDGETEYRGVEFAAFGELTPRLSISASGLWLDAEQVRGSPGIAGRRPENTPEWTGSLFAEWKPRQLRGFAINAGLFYVGERAVNPTNQAFIDGYTTVSAGLRYEREIGGRKIAGQVNVENVLAEDYWNAAGNGFLGVGAPRVVKFQLSAAL